MKKTAKRAVGDSKVSRHLKIINPPYYGASMPVQPKFEWWNMREVPGRTWYTFIIKDAQTGEIRRHKPIYEKSFRVPEPLEPGTHTVRVVAQDKKNRRFKIVSPNVLIEVKRDYYDKTRIHCIAPWTNLFMGRAYANPCCWLRKRAGMPYEPDLIDVVDFWNSEPLVQLRESLLTGNPRFCLPQCTFLKKTEYSPGEVFDNRLRDDMEAGELIQAAQNGCTSPAAEHYRYLREAYSKGQVILKQPINLKISLGSACQCNCIFCKKVPYQWTQHPKAFDLIGRYRSNLLQLKFTGGEPLLYFRPELIRHLDFSDNAFCFLVILTNGVALEDHAEELMNVRHLKLLTSLNAGTPQNFEKVQGSKDFSKVLRGISKVKQLRQAHGKETTIHMKFIYMKCNFREIPLFMKIACDLKPDMIIMSEVIIFRDARMDATEKITPDSAEWGELQELLDEAKCTAGNAGIKFRVRDTAKDDEEL